MPPNARVAPPCADDRSASQSGPCYSFVLQEPNALPGGCGLMKYVIEITGDVVRLDFWWDYEVVDGHALAGCQAIYGPVVLVA